MDKKKLSEVSDVVLDEKSNTFTLLVAWDEHKVDEISLLSIEQNNKPINDANWTVQESSTKWGGVWFLIQVRADIEISRFGMVELKANFSNLPFNMQFWGKDLGSFQSSSSNFGVMCYAPTLEAMQSKIDQIKSEE